jgi:hypothetical protein
MPNRLHLALARAVHVLAAAAFAVAAYFAVAPAAHAQAKKAAAFDAAPCLACHKPIKEFHDSGKHKGWRAPLATATSTSTSPTGKCGRARTWTRRHAAPATICSTTASSR